MFGEYASDVINNPAPTLSDFGGAGKSDSKDWNFGDWSQKNPKTAGFLKGFLGSRGLLGGSGSKGKKEDEDKSKMFGFGSTTRQLAEGLSETRDPFYMHMTPGQYIPGKKGAGRVALEAGIGAAKGFVMGGPAGAVGGTLGSLGGNLDQF